MAFVFTAKLKKNNKQNPQNQEASSIEQPADHIRYDGHLERILTKHIDLFTW